MGDLLLCNFWRYLLLHNNIFSCMHLTAYFNMIFVIYVYKTVEQINNRRCWLTKKLNILVSQLWNFRNFYPIARFLLELNILVDQLWNLKELLSKNRIFNWKWILYSVNYIFLILIYLVGIELFERGIFLTLKDSRFWYSLPLYLVSVLWFSCTYNF
jgi:hypothetical protein